MRPLKAYLGANVAVLTAMLGLASAAADTEPSAPANREGAGSSSTLVPQVAEGDRVDELPREAQGIEIKEKIGAKLPLDLEFRDSEGKRVRVGDYFDGMLPVILTFNYSSCPMLCSSQLNGLSEAMRNISLTAGEQYRIITVAIDPLQGPESTRDMKDKYLAGFPKEKQGSIRAGWQFLTGEEASIKALADSVGYAYRYLEETKEFSHAATLIFVSPDGVVTRYYHGIYYEPDKLTSSIFKAGIGEEGVSMGFLLACFRPSHENGHAETAESVMRYGAMGFVVFLLAAFGTWQMMRAKSSRQE